MPALKPPKTVFSRNTNYTNTNGVSRERISTSDNIELSYFSLLANFTKLLKDVMTDVVYDDDKFVHIDYHASSAIRTRIFE